MISEEIQHIRRNNLRRLIQEKFAGSVNAFAKYIDRPASFFYDALSGKRPLGEKIMRYIEKTFDLLRCELDRTEDGSFEQKHYELVKVLPGIEVLPVSIDLIKKNDWEVNDLSWITVDEDSMLPTLMRGSRVLVNKNDRKLMNNKVYAIRKGNGIFIRRIFIDPLSNDLFLHADNSTYYRPCYLAGIPEGVEIIGRALMRSAEEL